MTRSVHKTVAEQRSKKTVCYVLITCQQPTDDGDMQVEMSYEGDAALASYLLHGAQMAIDEQDIEEGSCQKKIVSIGGG